MATIKYLAFEHFLVQHLEKGGLRRNELFTEMEDHGLNRLERLRYLAGLADPKEAEGPLPVNIGKEVSLTHYGVLGHSFMQSRSLEDLIQNIDRNLWILDPVRRQGLQLSKIDKQFQLIYPSPPLWPELPYFFLDLFFAALVQQSRELSGWKLTDLHLYLCRPKPDHPYHAELLNINVTYEAKQDYLSLPQETATKEFPKSISLHSPLFKAHCNALLMGMKREGNLVEQVRQQLLLHPPHLTGTEKIAQNIGMSGRSLRRKLAIEQTSFREIQKDVLRHLSHDYLLETPLSVTDIAHFLGYHDTSTYNRAFRKLTGLTPAAYRRQKFK